MPRRALIDRPHVLSDVWQPILEEVYNQRSRPRASYADFAEAICRFLDRAGLLDRFAAPGTDPIARIEAFNEDAS